MRSPTARCLLAALAIRLLALVVLLLSDWALEDYDTSVEFTSRVCAPGAAGQPTPSSHTLSEATGNNSGTAIPSRTRQLLAPFQRLVVWDTVFFLDISWHGYSHEQQYAFFPLFPGEEEVCW